MDLRPAVEVAIGAGAGRVKAGGQGDPAVAGSRAAVGAVGVAAEIASRVRVGTLVYRGRGLGQVAGAAGG